MNEPTTSRPTIDGLSEALFDALVEGDVDALFDMQQAYYKTYPTTITRMPRGCRALFDAIDEARRYTRGE